jgi:hypothetical protein
MIRMCRSGGGVQRPTPMWCRWLLWRRVTVPVLSTRSCRTRGAGRCSTRRRWPWVGRCRPARGLAVQSPVRPEIVFFSVRRKRSTLPWVCGWLAREWSKRTPRRPSSISRATRPPRPGRPVKTAPLSVSRLAGFPNGGGRPRRRGRRRTRGWCVVGRRPGETRVVNTGPRRRDLGARPQKSLPRDAGGALLVLPALTGWTG